MTSTPTTAGVGPPRTASDGVGGTRTAAHLAATRVVEGVQRVVRGRPEAVRLVACALLSGGHALVEDVPGSGKTTMARAFARTLGGRFSRVQATADLLPADITGSGVWEQGTGGFRFVPGPVFAHVVLVDELNRTSPRTQSAFLEALDEAAVTVDGVRHALPDPFFVIATQNPLEQHGTFPLPEAQLDRFTVSVRLGALDARTELAVVREQLVRATVDDLPAVTTPEEVRDLRTATRSTHVADPVLQHALEVVRATRQDPRVAQGASSRAALALVRAAQAHALLAGRDFVNPDDTKALAVPVLAHRLVLHSGPSREASAAVVADLVSRVPVPLTSP